MNRSLKPGAAFILGGILLLSSSLLVGTMATSSDPSTLLPAPLDDEKQQHEQGEDDHDEGDPDGGHDGHDETDGNHTLTPGCHETIWIRGGGSHLLECRHGWGEYHVEDSSWFGSCYTHKRDGPELVLIVVYDYCFPAQTSIGGAIQVSTARPACHGSYPYEGIETWMSFHCSGGWGDVSVEVAEELAWSDPCVHFQNFEDELEVRVFTCIGLASQSGVATQGTIHIREK